MTYGETLFWPHERWRELQARRLAEHLRHAADSVLYRGKGLEQAARGLEDSPGTLAQVMQTLPVTTKGDLAAAELGGRRGRDLCAVPLEQVAEWVCTSGTAGRPLDVPLTAMDLERLAENEAAAFSLAGMRAGDLCILAVGMDRMFVAGLAYWLGARKLGVTCVRAGPQAVSGTGLADLVQRLKGNEPGNGRVFVVAVPSFLTGAERGRVVIDGVIAIGEPVRGTGAEAGLGLNALGEALREKFNCAIMSTYACTETCTTFAEGPECCGGHLNPGLAILEALDHEGRAVSEGEIGEIVVTPLGAEGMPLVRFGTGDMAAVYGGKCACGRTTPRAGAIAGRRHQLLKFRGTSIYPAAIVEAVRGVNGVADCVVIAEAEHALSDRVTIHVALRAGSAEMGGEIEARLRRLLRVAPGVRFVSGEELRAIQGPGRKVQHFIDRRGLS